MHLLPMLRVWVIATDVARVTALRGSRMFSASAVIHQWPDLLLLCMNAMHKPADSLWSLVNGSETLATEANGIHAGLPVLDASHAGSSQVQWHRALHYRPSCLSREARPF
jgi:hypothetical protein